MSIAGFTGSRRGLTVKQIDAISFWLIKLRPTKVVHGDCIGADADFDRIAEIAGIARGIYPCDLKLQRAFCNEQGADLLAEPAPPLERNRHIVDVADVILACPSSTTEELRSGTWATIRYARKTDTPMLIIYPDGRYEKFGAWVKLDSKKEEPIK